MLCAAVSDLRAHGRPLVGFAPTAKAARVLETGTGMGCDTVAKLVYEHTRPHRPPRPDWDLPAGTTVVIDEAGMLATCDLHQLTRLADQHCWRLALVGDPHQLQAVGRCGMYAATEPGNQSDTATGSITLATPTTTCRGFYVAITRGQSENLVCVVTDTHDITDAIDVLEQILASDRADHPATRARRDLAATTPPTPALTPRCQIPDWFEQLHRNARNDYAAARTERDHEQRRDAERQQRIDQLTEQLADLEHQCRPHDDAIATTALDLRTAEERHRRAERELADSGLLRRRTARHAVADTADDVAAARTALDDLTRRAQPLLDRRAQVHRDRDRLRREQRRDRQFGRSLDGYDNRIGTARQQLDALETWQQWATGKNLSPAALINATRQLEHAGGHHVRLAQPLATWIEQHDLAPPPPAPARQPIEPELRPELPGLELGL